VAGKDVEVHLAPAGGLQTYAQPYPRFIDRDLSGPFINAGEQLDIAEVRGTWVQVSTAEDGVIGWVDGRKLLPPVGGAVRVAPTSTQIPAPAAAAPGPTISLTAGTIVGVIASIGIIIGAVMQWVHAFFTGFSSFDISAQYLFDNQTRSHDPKIGIFLVALGVIGLLLSLLSRGAIWRVIVGVITIAIPTLYFIQVTEQLSGTGRSFTDVTGAGPWVTGIAGLVLMISTAMR
jgi:hypothetical protein